jgi:hypothetical protein
MRAALKDTTINFHYRKIFLTMMSGLVFEFDRLFGTDTAVIMYTAIDSDYLTLDPIRTIILINILQI